MSPLRLNWLFCGRSVQDQCGALLSGLRTRGLDSTFGCDLGAELCNGMLVPDAAAHAPHEQRFTDIWRATCYRSAEACSGQPQLQSATQLCRTTSRLRLFRVSSCFELSTLHHSGRASLTYPCPSGACRRRCHSDGGAARQFHDLEGSPASRPINPVPGACAQRVGLPQRRTGQRQTAAA